MIAASSCVNAVSFCSVSLIWAASQTAPPVQVRHAIASHVVRRHGFSVLAVQLSQQLHLGAS
eukprot:588800-Amphidinium_carterae.1